MLKLLAAAAIGAAVALSPLVASAQTTTAPTTSLHNQHRSTGSHRSEMRKRSNSSRQRARASAEHVRKMRTQ